MPFLGYLLADSWQTVIIGREYLIPVRCPQPARYCLHELAVAALRAGAENPKVDKDMAQAGILAVILAEEDQGALLEAAQALTAPMFKHARKTLPRLERMLAAEYPGAMELLRHLIVGPAAGDS